MISVRQKIIKRIFDIFFSIILILVLILPIILVYLLNFILEKDNIIFVSKRIGINNKYIYMPKFRTFSKDTEQIATHLMNEAEKKYTKLGKFMRKTSLDELPQLFTILSGQMSFVGPRPALFNQYDLIEKRTNLGIHIFKPGVTGLAQVYGRDKLSIDEKVNLDKKYIDNYSFLLDCKIILLTILKILKTNDITH